MASLAVTAQNTVTILPDKAPVSSALTTPALASSTASTFTHFISTNGMYTWGLPGTTAGTTYDVAMYVPGYLEGTTITSVGFRLYNPTVLKDVKAWVSATLPTSASKADECQSVDSPVAYSAGNNEVELTTAYTVPATGCYVGYSFTVDDASASDGQEPVLTDHNANYVRAFYVKGNDGAWEEQRFANSTLTVGVSNLPELAVAFDSHDLGKVEQTFLPGESATVTIPFIVTGSTAVNRVTYQVKDLTTGETSKETTTSCTRKKFGNVTTFKYKFSAAETAGINEHEITILKVNGKALSTATGSVGKVVVKTFDKAIDRTVVEEQFTATSAPWEVCGMTGMKHMAEQTASKWIGIAVHADEYHYADPMYCYDYRYAANTTAYPAAKLNRGSKLDPYYGTQTSTALGIANAVAEAAARPAEATVNVSAAWNADSTQVAVTSEASFVIDRTDAPYAMAYVLVGNGLKATTTDKATAYPWYQYNSYYGTDATDENLAEWAVRGQLFSDILADEEGNYYTLPLITDQTYDNVALKAQGAQGGVAGSIAAPIVKGAAQTHTTTFDLTDGIRSTTWSVDGTEGENLLQNKAGLKVVAYLLNTNTGEIINADECDILSATGIQAAATQEGEARIVARYNAAGQRITSPVRGLNILKMSNGKTVKVLVK